MQEHLDAGEPLGEGVVDFVGDALAFGGHACGAFGFGELILGAQEFVDEFLAFLADGFKRPEGEGNGDGDQCGHSGP